MQGVPYIRTSKSLGAKLLWTVLFLLCLSMLTGHLHYLFAVFYSYPKHSTIDLGFSALSFPAVTFCNVNPVRRSRLEATSDTLRHLVTQTEPGYIVEKMAAEYEQVKVRGKRSTEKEDSRETQRRRMREERRKRAGKNGKPEDLQLGELLNKLSNPNRNKNNNGNAPGETSSSGCIYTPGSNSGENKGRDSLTTPFGPPRPLTSPTPTPSPSDTSIFVTAQSFFPTLTSPTTTTPATSELTQLTTPSPNTVGIPETAKPAPTSFFTFPPFSGVVDVKKTTPLPTNSPFWSSLLPDGQTIPSPTKPSMSTFGPIPSSSRRTETGTSISHGVPTVNTPTVSVSSASSNPSTVTPSTQKSATSTFVPIPSSTRQTEVETWVSYGTPTDTIPTISASSAPSQPLGVATTTSPTKPSMSTFGAKSSSTTRPETDILIQQASTTTNTPTTFVSTTSNQLAGSGTTTLSNPLSTSVPVSPSTQPSQEGSTTTPANSATTIVTRSPTSSINSENKNSSEDSWKENEQTYSQKEIEFINGLDLGVDFTNVRQRQKLKDEEEKKVKEEGGEGEQEEPFVEPSVSASIREEFLLLYSNIEQEQRQVAGHQLEDMMVDCSFAGRRCHPQNFSLLSSTMFGNCFTIDHPAMVTTRGGYHGGLSLVVFLESEEYLRGVTMGTGVQVIIHPHNTMPFPEEDGIAIMAGTETNIALRRLNINRLGKPHGTCQEGSVFKEKYKHTYTRRACQHFCEHSTVMDTCRCYNEQSGQYVRNTLKPDLPPCRYVPEVRCMLKVQRQYEKGDVHCDCDNPCSEQTYYKTVSMRQWPADEYTGVLVETLCTQRDAARCAKYRQAESRNIAQSFVKLNIFYEDLNYENITEVEDYELVQFASDVGGTVGLWLGLSFLSGFEVLQFFFEVFVYFITFGPCRKKAKTPERRRPRETSSRRRRHSLDSAMTSFSGY
ncbi:uncharacterized protein [Littorina saxatilis]|uniref:uncharacterized protein n=1 Tax=Littorina saxatilis TaxID=31220 RepID=UPI0038B4C874